ncbi:MAG: hypothetical protein ACJ8GJ_06220 [Vitreoscilla sp.]
MSKITLRRRHATLAASASTLAILLLAGCGGGTDGGVVPDKGTSTSLRMSCLSTCVQSDTASTGQMEAHFTLVDNGKKAQAQAGFFDGFTVGYNVELNGDSLYFVQGGVATRMGLPISPGAGIKVHDALPFSPYVMDFPQLPATEVAGQFELRRAGQTYVSQASLPPPFSIVAPADNTTVSKSSNAVPLQLDSAQPQATWTVENSQCRDTSNVLHVQVGNGIISAFSTDDGRSVQFHAADFMASLQFDDANGARLPLASCVFILQAAVTHGGTLADGFAIGSSVSGVQLRQVTVTAK